MINKTKVSKKKIEDKEQKAFEAGMWIAAQNIKNYIKLFIKADVKGKEKLLEVINDNFDQYEGSFLNE